MKEKRAISMYDVRQACITYNWYTCGDCEEYDKMLTYVNNIDVATLDEIETIATDIKEHSNTDYEIKNIMYVLINECCITFIEEC